MSAKVRYADGQIPHLLLDRHSIESGCLPPDITLKVISYFSLFVFVHSNVVTGNYVQMFL